jgi:uncharacterized protein
MNMFCATANVSTDKASRYLQQLCKHWSHNLQVTFDANQGRVVFPKDARGAIWEGDGIFTMTALPDTLVCGIEASEAGQLEGLKGAVERHLNRFSFREGDMIFEWQTA